MKYESNILERLIKTYGVVGNPKYVSEIIKQFIIQGKECYPNLFTYQADWLAHIDEFGLNPTYTVSYTGQSIYAPNTKEKPVKSAILKGQTLVNISSLSGEITIKPNSTQFIESSLIQQNKTFTFMFNCTSVPSTGFIEFRQILDNTALKMENINVVQGYNKFKVTTVNKEVNKFRLKNDSTSNTDFVFNNLLILDGDYINIDVPYFEGMQSVKMPVLTTTGKNLFDEKLENNKDINGNTGVVLNGGRTIPINFISVEPNTSYTLTRPVAKGNVGIRYYSKSQGYLSSQAFTNYTGKFSATFTTPSNCYFIKFIDEANTLEKGYQIEQGTQATSYQPYQTNILTVNEDVTIRSNGDICDELNLLTGQLTQRIGEDGVVLSQEDVKTVDLTIHDKDHQKVERLTSFEGGTHFTTSSQDGTLLPTLTVDVVTDLEETLMVCSLEGNTM